MNFPKATIKFPVRLLNQRTFPRKNWQGRECELLGVWKWPGDKTYAAIRFPEAQHQYHCLHPRYLV